MKTNIKKIIIVLVVIVLAFVAYQYFFAKETPAKPTTALSSSKTATNTTNTTTAKTTTTAVKKDTDFLSTLLNISKIKVDGTIFSSPSFNSLQDNNVPIINEEIVGRSNPFAPLEGVKNTLNIDTETDKILGEVIPFKTN
jgi:hypothetical protein